MIFFWIIGIALIAWIVRELIKKESPTETKPASHEDGKDKKDSTCCH